MNFIHGRERIIYHQIDQLIDKNYHVIKGITDHKCNRCQSVNIYPFYCSHCKKECRYCRDCLNLGMVTDCCYLINHITDCCQNREITFQFNSILSNKQQQASDFIKRCVQNNDNVLLTAVTGAGKTEMIFESIRYTLEQGKRVCLASPRVDVCLELYPRIQQVFPDEKIALLHGKMSEPYQYTHLVIATTHQLLKFNNAFDLLIIDESDSYPFEKNKILQNRVAVTLKKKHSLIYLTATPNKKQLYLVKIGFFKQFELNARYHQHALPEPIFKYIGNWKSYIETKHIQKIVKYINQLLNNKRRFLLFVPHIYEMEQLETLLKKYIPQNIKYTSVSSKDENRLEKVAQMRNEKYNFLLTTTILERGVTFSNIDVIVLGSEDYVFNQASLVQIAGRVGRKQDFPTGKVLFLHNGISKEMVKAKKFIQKMNKKAKQENLIG